MDQVNTNIQEHDEPHLPFNPLSSFLYPLSLLILLHNFASPGLTSYIRFHYNHQCVKMARMHWAVTVAQTVYVWASGATGCSRSLERDVGPLTANQTFDSARQCTGRRRCVCTTDCDFVNGRFYQKPPPFSEAHLSPEW